MYRFTSHSEAQTFLCDTVDVPVTASHHELSAAVQLHTQTIDLPNDRFTNSYDVTFDDSQAYARIKAFDTLSSVHDYVSTAELGNTVATMSGGFFYLVDKASASPRQPALNLSVSGGLLRSLPVQDREAVIAGRNSLDIRTIAALGTMSINGHEYDWSGSLTDYETPVKIYANGNAVIHHEPDEITGSARVLHEPSRFTPPIVSDELIDIGFVGRGGSESIGVFADETGGVDIFAHDYVVRCPREYITGNTDARIHTIGGLAMSRFAGGAFSAGPMLNRVDFSQHPINFDKSLGSRPPFVDVKLARTVLYKTLDGLTHMRLFDGRPGSDRFTGLTPTEAVSIVMSDGPIESGCFLDPGQTAKLSVVLDGQQVSYGNRHYLRWPKPDDNQFLWVPDQGRPVANVIAV